MYIQLIGMAAVQIKLIGYPSPHNELKAFVRAADPDFLSPCNQAFQQGLGCRFPRLLASIGLLPDLNSKFLAGVPVSPLDIFEQAVVIAFRARDLLRQSSHLFANIKLL